jgi:hypothetical protein
MRTPPGGQTVKRPTLRLGEGWIFGGRKRTERRGANRFQLMIPGRAEAVPQPGLGIIAAEAPPQLYPQTQATNPGTKKRTGLQAGALVLFSKPKPKLT